MNGKFPQAFRTLSLAWHWHRPFRLAVAFVSLLSGALLAGVILDLNGRVSRSFSDAMAATMQRQSDVLILNNPEPLKALGRNPSIATDLAPLGIQPYRELSFILGDRRIFLTVTFCALPECLNGIAVSESFRKENPETSVEFSGKSLQFLVSESDPAYPVTDFSVLPPDLMIFDRIAFSRNLTPSEKTAWLDVFPGARLAPAVDLSGDAGGITRAFRHNLLALAAIGLLVALYLTYASLTISFANRSPMMRTMQHIGFEPGQLRLVLYSEAILLGLLAGLAAWLLSTWMADSGWQSLARLLPSLFPVVPVRNSSGWESLAVIPLLTAGAWLAARFALPSGPRYRSGGGWWAGFATLVFVLSVILMLQSRIAWPGYVAVATLFYLQFRLSGVLLGRLVPWTMNGIRVYSGRITALVMAAAGALQLYHRHYVAPAAALSTALSLAFAMSVLVSSFRGTLTSWLNTHLVAEVYLSLDTSLSAPDREELIREAEARFPGQVLPLFTATNRVSSAHIPAGEIADLFAEPFSRMNRLGPVSLKSGTADSVLISETAALRWSLEPGDWFAIADRKFRVSGIFRNYSSRRGVFLFDSESLEYPLPFSLQPEGLAFYTPVESATAFLDSRAAAGTYRKSEQLRSAALVVFDSTFRITNLLQGVVLVLAAFAIALSQVALMNARKKEYAILASMDSSSRVIVAVLETCGVLFTACAVGIFFSAILSYILVDGINRFSFGWSLQWQVDWPALGWILLTGLSAGLLSAWWQALKFPWQKLYPYLKAAE